MMRYIVTILFIIFSTQLWAEDQEFSGLVLAKAPIDQTDMASIKRGAKIFATTCMSCHTLQYLRYDKVAQEAGITIDKMPLNVKTWPFGVKPPDLSLEADVRGVDWIYTYLHSFYVDPSRPTGSNNLLVNNTAMTAILSPLQGAQVLVKHAPESGIILHDVEWYDLLKLDKQGSMTPEQFDAHVADIVNFLAYAAEPFHAQQQRIGYWVLGFLVILFIFAFLLKKEYWKDVKKYKK
jgi:ubiquinol-cytochrome c reductase cytochrome c1 subunit